MGTQRRKSKNPRLQADDVLLYVEACSQHGRGAGSLSEIVDRINSSREAAARLGTKKRVTIHQITTAQTRLCVQLGYERDTPLICTHNGGISEISEEGNEALRWCKRFALFLTIRPPRERKVRQAVAVGGSILHDIVPSLLRQLETQGHTPSELAFDTFVPRFIADQLITRRVVLGVAWYGGETRGKEFDGAEAVFREPLGKEVSVALLMPDTHPLATGSPGSPVPAERLSDQALIYPPLTPLRRMAGWLALSVPSVRRVRVSDLPGVARQVASGLGLGLYPAHDVHLRPAMRAYGLTWRTLQPPADAPDELRRPLRLCVYTSRKLGMSGVTKGIPPEAIFAALKAVVQQSEQQAGGWRLVSEPATLTAGRFEWLFVGLPDGRFVESRVESDGDVVRVTPGAGGTPFTMRSVGVATTTHLLAADDRPGHPRAITFVRAARGERGDQFCLCGGGLYTTRSGLLVPVTAFLSVTRLDPTDLGQLLELASGDAGACSEK
jgi:DNA-binding transcriptional LysR family regulator